MDCVRIFKSWDWSSGSSAAVSAYISVFAFDVVLFCKKLPAAAHMIYGDEAV